MCRRLQQALLGTVILVVGPSRPAVAAPAGELQLIRRAHDPYGTPRPGDGHRDVPLRTSFYCEIGVPKEDPADRVVPESVAVTLNAAEMAPLIVLHPGGRIAEGYHGKLEPRTLVAHAQSLVVYIDADRSLRPNTTYAVRVTARSRAGRELPAKTGAWLFTTEAAPIVHSVHFDCRLTAPSVHWQGGFFSGFCSPSFCTSSQNRIPTYELMAQVRKTSPRAWSLQRDFWMTGMEHQPQFLSGNLPNLVRERETRRITAIRPNEATILLEVEDFFGHEQYGIPAGRPLSGDYHPGDEVLIADGVHSARAKVFAVQERDQRLLVTPFPVPAGGWKLAYQRPLPRAEDPNAPGLFPPGGCYLRKFAPAGTPAYYWGRLDHEWDLDQRRFHRRLLPNFADAPGDLAIDGRNWTTAKDYVELHTVVRAITGHVIDRYGAAALEFPWSVFNEPDLGALFWRSDWIELQKFYDYTVDGILRAFEDHGLDAARVRVGGLELAAIFGVHLRLQEFLAHCSPRAHAKGALELNAAYADRRLDGRRSRRVEQLCRLHQGRGAPCDFISIHAYNRSDVMAAKLARAKEMALEIDPDYFQQLAICSHESCPGWDQPPDPAYTDSYLGNGYFPTWCADVTRRQLQRAAADPRFAAGETILTFWPWPNTNFGGGNDCVRQIHIDDDGDGIGDRSVTVPMPILHFLGLLNQMGNDFVVLSERTVGGHVLSGFAGVTNREIRLLVYVHQALDTQSRSAATFAVALKLSGARASRFTVTEYRFDREHNSYFRLACALREQEHVAPALAPEQLQAALGALASGAPSAQNAALDDLARFGPRAAAAKVAVFEFLNRAADEPSRAKAYATLQRLNAPIGYPATRVHQLEQQAELQPTPRGTFTVLADGTLELPVFLLANGASMLVLEPVPPAAVTSLPPSDGHRDH